MALEVPAPAIELCGARCEADMARTMPAMGRCGGEGFGLDLGFQRIEDEQHALAAMQEDELVFELAPHLEAENGLVEMAQRLDVLAIDDGLENGFRPHWTACFCIITSSPMPCLASAINSRKRSCENGS